MSENYWSRPTGGRLGRRTLFRNTGTAVAGFAGLAVVGCGNDNSASKSANPTTGANPTKGANITKGGNITTNTGRTNTQSMDPHTTLNRAFTYWGIIGNKLLYSDRHTIEPLQPGLVGSWEQPEPLKLILKARQGVKWHGGKITNARAFTAQDVAYNLERIAGKYDSDRSAQFQRASTLEGLAAARAVDGSTVEVTLSKPNAAFLQGMADWRNWVVAKENVEADPNFTDFGAVAGTGPFIIKKWDASQQIGEYAANPEYAGVYGDGPYLDTYTQVSIPDDAAADSAFFSGRPWYVRPSGTAGARQRSAATAVREDLMRRCRWG